MPRKPESDHFVKDKKLTELTLDELKEQELIEIKEIKRLQKELTDIAKKKEELRKKREEEQENNIVKAYFFFGLGVPLAIFILQICKHFGLIPN